MQTYQSKNPTFRYRWAGHSSDAQECGDLAATRVLSVQVPIDTLGTYAQDQAAKEVPLVDVGVVGDMDTQDYGERFSTRVRDRLRGVLQPIFGERAIRYLSTDYSAIVGGAMSFHHDMPWSGALYGAWHLGGPERIVRFSEMDLDIAFKPGTLLLFDPCQPHALLKVGAKEFDAGDYEKSDVVRMLGLVIKRMPKGREALGIEVDKPRKHAHIRTTRDQYEACPRTGSVFS